MDRVFVGVDISKDSFSAAGLDAEGNEYFSGSYSKDSDGFGKFLEIVTTHCRDLPKGLVGMESTGCYHLNLFSFLTFQGIQALGPSIHSFYQKLSWMSTLSSSLKSWGDQCMGWFFSMKTSIMVVASSSVQINTLNPI